MDIEVKIDENYSSTKVVIYSNKENDEVLNIIDVLSTINNKVIKAFKNEMLYILNQNEIEKIYSENGKIYLQHNNELYTIKNRLYELEELFDKKIFIRISNSEIVNFQKVKNIDFKLLGTLVLNFKNGNKFYVSRRYIPKIKNFLDNIERND